MLNLMPQKNPILNEVFYFWKRNNWMLNPRAYIGKHKDIPINKPVFLFGLQGGGLTLVSRMLRRHPVFVSSTGNYKYWSGADEMSNVFVPLVPAALAGTRYKVPDPHKSLFITPRSWTYASNELLPFYRKTGNDATPELERKLKRLIRFIIKSHALDTKNARFTDKSQVNTVRISLLNKLLSDCNPKFILIVMNPYALCYKAAQGKAIDMRKIQMKLSFNERLAICAQHWANSIRCALMDKTDNMIIIRFEDLLENPKESLTQICEFLEIDFRLDMLPQEHHKIPLGTRYLDRWYPLETKRNQSYFKTISEEEREIIESECKIISAKLGYLFNGKKEMESLIIDPEKQID